MTDVDDAIDRILQRDPTLELLRAREVTAADLTTVLDALDVEVEVVKAAPAVRHDFEEWFLRALEEEANLAFIRGRDQMIEVLARWFAVHGQVPMAARDAVALSQLIFDLASTVSLGLAGLGAPTDLAHRLARLGFVTEEIEAFPVAAWRFGALRQWIAEHPGATLAEIRAQAQRTALTPAEHAAIGWAQRRAADRVRPILLRDGGVMSDAQLACERAWIREQVSGALAVRTDPLTLGRAMYQARAEDSLRDWERVARTEMADSYAHGAFLHDVQTGRFPGEALVYRIPRPTACRVCLALYTNPDGSLRLYRVRDLLTETTTLIEVGVKTTRPVRATIGVAHPNDLCSAWMRARSGEVRLGAERYRTARAAVRLEVA